MADARPVDAELGDIGMREHRNWNAGFNTEMRDSILRCWINTEVWEYRYLENMAGSFMKLKFHRVYHID
ncbi:hypothetical protein ACSAZK_16715 [Methanosarcina sp. Mfa9]|uniref:hypothetical protein n=1 Tax=Methanosarcina sp. Mfa9 TaxID=3439063 RepID=UPI003F874CDC